MPRVSQEQAKLNRQRVVEVASALFRERGLHGIGVVDIMAAAGLTHGGFYGQFASKDALAAEAFDAAISAEYRANLDAFIENYLSLAHVRTPGRGCPVAALVNDVGREPPGAPCGRGSPRGSKGSPASSRTGCPERPRSAAGSAP